jgi:hypothetical protein
MLHDSRDPLTQRLQETIKKQEQYDKESGPCALACLYGSALALHVDPGSRFCADCCSCFCQCVECLSQATDNNRRATRNDVYRAQAATMQGTTVYAQDMERADDAGNCFGRLLCGGVPFFLGFSYGLFKSATHGCKPVETPTEVFGKSADAAKAFKLC